MHKQRTHAGAGLLHQAAVHLRRGAARRIRYPSPRVRLALGHPDIRINDVRPCGAWSSSVRRTVPPLSATMRSPHAPDPQPGTAPSAPERSSVQIYFAQATIKIAHMCGRRPYGEVNSGQTSELLPRWSGSRQHLGGMELVSGRAIVTKPARRSIRPLLLLIKKPRYSMPSYILPNTGRCRDNSPFYPSGCARIEW